MAFKGLNTAMNVLGVASAVGSFLNLGKGPAQGATKNSKFYAEIQGKRGIERTSRFQLEITPPKVMTTSNLINQGGSMETLTLRCDSATVPGISFNTVDIQRYGYGLNEKVITGATYGDFACSFIADRQGVIRSYFETWMNRSMFFQGQLEQRGGSSKPRHNAALSVSGMRPWEYEYRDEYVCTAFLITYDESETKLVGHKFFDIFPIGIGEVQYNWGDSDNLVRIPINFAYSYRLSELYTLGTSEATRSKGGSLGLFGKLIKAGTAIQVFASLKKPQSIGDAINVVNNAKIVSSAFLGR